jgi:hypothetical protein
MNPLKLIEHAAIGCALAAVGTVVALGAGVTIGVAWCYGAALKVGDRLKSLRSH